MRKESIITIALSLVIAGTGGIVLRQAMAKEQNQTVVNTVKNEKTTVSDYREEIGKDENAVERVGATADGTYAVCLLAPQPWVKESKADMPAEEAAGIAVKKVEEIYGKLNIKGRIIMELRTGKGCDSEGEKFYTYREYHGYILTEESIAYEFEINSITGEVNSVDKKWGIEDYCASEDVEFDKDIKNNAAEYSNIAKKFMKK